MMPAFFRMCRSFSLAGSLPPASHSGQLFSHPRGLFVLFLTEIWERFSFFGMRALLILYMTAAPKSGGLGFSVPLAATICGLYVALCFMAGIPGGWLADNIYGQKRTVFYGGVIIMLGHLCLAIPNLFFFYGGLGMLIIGTGLLKPNIVCMLGKLYSNEDQRRDSGFSFFYMGISLGALPAPLVCGFLAQSQTWNSFLVHHGFSPAHSWHWGFGAAAIGMALGLLQYGIGMRHLGTADASPSLESSIIAQRRVRKIAFLGMEVLGLGLLCAFVLQKLGWFQLTVSVTAKALSILVTALPIVYFPFIMWRGGYDRAERSRILAILVLGGFTILFWAAFEQAGTSLNLFADRYTRNALYHWEFPSVYWQSVNALLVILLAPILSAVWIKLGKREPASIGKFILGMFCVSLAFWVMTGAAVQLGKTALRVSPMWLFATYFLCTIGELCLTPVSLSLVTRLAPARAVSQIMGSWFIAVSLGNVVSGQIAGLFESLPLPRLFGSVAGILGLGGLLLLCLRRPISGLMGRSDADLAPCRR